MGNAGDAQLALDVIDVGEIVDRSVVAAVVYKAQRIQKQPFHRGVSEVGVVIVDAQLTAQAGKRIQHRIADVIEDETAVDALRPVRVLLFLVRSLLLLPLLAL